MENSKVLSKKKPAKAMNHKFVRFALTRFLQELVTKGKKHKAENLIYRFFRVLDQRQSWESALKREKVVSFSRTLWVTPLGDKNKNEVPGKQGAFIYACITKARPVMEFKVGDGGLFTTKGKAVAVPTGRSLSLAIKWIVQGAKKRPGLCFEDKLYKELLSVLEGQGYASKKKYELYLVCRKAFLKVI